MACQRWPLSPFRPCLDYCPSPCFALTLPLHFAWGCMLGGWAFISFLLGKVWWVGFLNSVCFNNLTFHCWLLVLPSCREKLAIFTCCGDISIVVNVMANLTLTVLIQTGVVLNFYRSTILGYGGRMVQWWNKPRARGCTIFLGYSCAKCALVTLTKNNTHELASKGILVNGVNIGWMITVTENEHKLQSKVHKSEEWWKNADECVPLGRILWPADVAATVLFLLSGASDMMTGSILDLHPKYTCGMLSLSTEDTADR
jgi:hypothetical protein